MRTFNPPNLDHVKEIVFDTETDGLDWKKCKVVGYVLTWGPGADETVYFPVRHEGGGNYDPAQVEAWIRQLAARPDIVWTGHHMKFDLHMSMNHGIEFKGVLNCTQVNAALIDESQGSYSLEKCAKKYGVTEKKGDELYAHLASLFGGPVDRKQMANFWRLRGDDVLAVDYAVGDGTSTWEVWQYQKSVIELEKLDRVWAMECRVIRTLFRMERRGVLVDMERFHEVCRIVEAKVNALRSKVPETLNVRSTKQMVEYMTARGCTDWPTTKPTKRFPNGQPSFTSKWLETVEPGRDIVQMKKYTNLQNTFLQGQILNHLHNGRIHPTFNQTKMDDYGTVTGRLSCSDPNLQQVPKRDKELAPLFRSIFIPDPGYTWSANDYKQQEFVVFADYSEAQGLIDGYNQDPPVDMHQYAANEMGVERDPTAKRLNLGKLYGMGVAKLAVSLGIPEGEARVLSKMWDARIPEAKTFLRDAEATARARGYVRTKLGRRRRFHAAEEHIAGNAIIQMCSADITKLKMAAIDEYFERTGNQFHMMLQIHDELDWQLPVGMEDSDMQKEALRIMEDFGPDSDIHLNVRLRVDASLGKNWSEATFG